MLDPARSAHVASWCEPPIFAPAPRGEASFQIDAARNIAIRLADSDGLRSQASILVNRLYAGRGYGAGHRLGQGEHSTTFTATSGDRVVGTITLTVDTPAGLATDQTFRAELDRFRAVPGVRLCELTKFAVDPATRSPQALAALFHVIFIYGMQRHDCTDLLIEVHPRHVRYYEAMLAFTRVGAPRIDGAVEWWPRDVPVQLLRLRVADIRRQIDRHAGGAGGQGRSLYRHFFSAAEERGIAARVAAAFGNPVGTAPGPVGREIARVPPGQAFSAAA